MYVEVDCKTFSEYVRRLGISLGEHSLGQASVSTSSSNVVSTITTAPVNSPDTQNSPGTSSATSPSKQTVRLCSNYASLLATASPEKLAKEGLCVPEITFEELKRLSGSEDDSNSERNTPEESVATPPKSPGGAMGGVVRPKETNEKQSPITTVVKTQEQLDFEYANLLMKKMEQEEEGSVTHGTDPTQIEADHEFALSLARELESEDHQSEEVAVVCSSDDESNSDVINISSGSSDKQLRKRKASNHKPVSKRPKGEDEVILYEHGGARSKHAVLQKAWQQPPEVPAGAKSRFVSPPRTAVPPVRPSRWSSPHTDRPTQPQPTPEQSTKSMQVDEGLTGEDISPSTSGATSSSGRPFPMYESDQPDHCPRESARVSPTTSVDVGHLRPARFISPPGYGRVPLPAQDPAPHASGIPQPPTFYSTGLTPGSFTDYRIPRVHSSKVSSTNHGSKMVRNNNSMRGMPGNSSRGMPAYGSRRGRSPVPNYGRQRPGAYGRQYPKHNTSNHSLRSQESAMSQESEAAIDPVGLHEMKQIVFLDVDNWRNFFGRLPGPLPDKTFVWGFYGGATIWTEPRRYEYHINNSDNN